MDALSIFLLALLIAGIGLVFNGVVSLPLLLLLATVITGAIWLWDRFVLSKKRGKDEARTPGVEYSVSLFPVILLVFLLRSFLVEPFRIPSGSMMPTLLAGDFILVNKYTYGIRLPVADRKIIDVNQPQRGEVMVFHFPEDPSIDYIKRIVGVPGDLVEYRDKRLSINGQPLAYRENGTFSFETGGLNYVTGIVYQEKLGEHEHTAMTIPGIPGFLQDQLKTFPYQENCTYNEDGFACRVPEGHYFMMGDNRDGSNDSRYWGFVPDRNIVGKAFFIWMNFGDFKRIGTTIK
ncbi:signal peptidase I [Betaproteobacteria bacterium SCN2]|jgi:signal peptidase I|nr:signal peptidase I [Betaproteobacteria bacterium SCN2]